MFKKNREIYKKISVVALPIILQNIIDAAVNSADVLMLNTVGQTAISAVSLCSSFVGLIFVFQYGIGTGIAMLAAQYYGKKDMRTIEKIEGIGLRFALSLAIIAMVLCLFVPGLVMRVFTNDEELVACGIQYLRIIAPGFIFWAISSVYMSILRCIDKVSTSTVLEAIALVCNVCLNAVFIFGLFGAPKMGVLGVAIATTASRVIQFICCVVVSAKDPGVKLKLSTVFVKHPLLQKDFMTMALPAIANDVVLVAVEFADS